MTADEGHHGVVVGNGVWVAASFDETWTVTKIFATELEAYRAADNWEKVRFIPFGADVIDTLRFPT